MDSTSSIYSKIIEEENNEMDVKSTLSLILKQIAEIKCTMQKNSDESSKNFTLINEQISSITLTFEKIGNIEKTQNDLCDRMEILESRYDKLDQLSKNNSLIIHGIKKQTQPLEHTIKNLLNEGLNVNIQPSEITKCIKLNTKSNISPILIQFNNRAVIDAVFKAKTKYLNKLKQLNDGILFINEDLTAYRRMLLNEAKIVKKSNNFKFLWTRNGNIMMRKDIGNPVIFIKSKDDLKKITSS